MGSSEYGLRRVVAFTPEEEEANRSYETSPAVRNELSYAIRSERDPNKRAVLEQSYQQDFGEPSGVGGDDPGYSGALRSAFSAMGVPQDSIPPSASMRTRQSDSEGMLKAAFAAMEDKPVKQKRGIGDIAADTAMGFAKGAGSLVKGVGWLAGSDALTQAGSTAEDYWGAKQSAELQRQLAEVGKAEGVFETIGALWKNPAAIGDYIATSVPQMIPGMGVGSVGARGIVALAGNSARNAALKAGATEAAAMQAGRVAAEKAAEKSAMYFATGANMVGEGAISGGSTGAEVEQFMLDHGATPDQAKSEANKAAMMAGAWTTAGAGIGAGMETKAMLGQLKDAGIKGFAKNVGKEALEEAIQNPGEDYAAYQAKVQLDPTQTFDPGKSATLGAVTGGIMGAGFHAAGRVGERMTDKPVNDGADPYQSKPDQETAPTQEAPQITQPSAFSAEGEHIPYAQAAERTPYSQFNQENYGYSLPAAGTAFAVPATSRTVEGEVLGPLELPPGQKLLPQPPIDGESQRAYDLPRQMLENSEPQQPSVRQLATARGLLNHNPSATPESIARLMRVDDGMAQQLYQMWQQSQGAKNGAESSNGRNAEVAAQGAQGGRGILPGGGNVLASASAGDTGRASDSSKVASPSMRPAVSAGVSGAEGVAAANQPKALNENAAKRQAVQLTNQGYPTVAFPHPSQSGMWAIGSPEDAQSVAATPRVETPPEQTRNGLTNSGRPSASWVIRNKTTGEVIMETFDRKKVDALNTEKYEAVPILEHLQGLNRQHSGAIAGKPVSDISSGMLAQIAGSNQPSAGKAKAEVARRQQEQNAVDKRIADAEASGVVLSESDKAAIRESLQKAETLNAKANSVSIDPMNKGNAFPMGVGFTKITKRTEQRIDASVRRAGDAVDLYKKAEVAEKHADALLSGKGTDADIAKKAEQRTEMQRNLIERLLNWKKGDKIGKFTVDRVSFDKDGYPSSYTISGDGIVKGVMDKTDVAREFFGGNKDTLRKLVDEMRVDQADSKHGERKTWLLTAFKDGDEAVTGTTIDAAGSEVAGDTARRNSSLNANIADRQAEGNNTEDAGEELSHNRRNRSGSLKWSDIKDQEAALRVKEVTKAKVYQKPDYAALAEEIGPVKAHLVKQVYDHIAATPQTGRDVPTDAQLEAYIDAVNSIMDATIAWAKDAVFESQWRMTANGKTLVDTLYPEGWRPQRDVVVLLGGNRHFGGVQPGYKEIKRAEREIAKGWPGKREAWQTQGYKVVETAETAKLQEGRSSGNKVYYIEVGGRYFDSAPSKADGEKMIAEMQPWLLLNKQGRIVSQHQSEEQAVEAARNATKRGGSGGISDKGIAVENAERVGPARRMEGENVTSDQLKETFGFRGVNFGTWMKGKANDGERQLHLNHAYDAFLDLAEIIGVQPKAMSLNGMLGLAIGAQGNGKYAAHFVPGVNEINLTRTSGAGSLAHEFGHALDHYFARLGGLDRQAEPFLTEHTGKPAQGELRPEILDKFDSIVKEMNKRKMTPEEYEAEHLRNVERFKKNIAGWLKAVRHDFEIASINKVTIEDGKAKREKAISKLDALIERIRDKDLGDGRIAIGRYESASPVVMEIRELYKETFGRQMPKNNILGLQSNIDSLVYATSKRDADNSHTPQVSTDYAKNALSLDKDKGGKPYWSTNLEKFARAFDAFVTDTLDAKAAKNSYLSHAGREGATVPAGEERKAINEAFKALVDAIETKETDSGVAMFNAKSGSIGNPIDAAALESTIASVIAASPSQWRRDTVVTATLFSELPAPIVEKAKAEGYDAHGRNRDGQKLTGATYDGKVYLVQENISSEIEAEETLLHERIHQILHGNAEDENGKALRQSLGRLYSRIGGKDAIVALAKRIGADMSGPLAALPKVAVRNRPAFLVDEFLAHVEGQRAYEKFPQSVVRAIREFYGEFRDWLRSSKFVKIADAVGVNIGTFTQSDLSWTLKKIRQQQAGTGSKAIRFMTAWHGSPHDHDGFDSSKIGTGEGAQAYGWGHYFAGAREVAEWYRNKLASGYSLRGKKNYEHTHEEINAVFKIARLLSQGSKEQMAINLVAAEARRDVDQAKQLLAEDEANLGKKVDNGAGWGDLRYHTVTQEDVNEARDGLERAQKRLAVIEGIKPGDVVQNKGRLYQVELAPEPDEYLDWDKPLSEQGEKIKAALDGVEFKYKINDSTKGEDIYLNIALDDSRGFENTGYKAASEYLHSIGIRGIKYLDGSSRPSIWKYDVDVFGSSGSLLKQHRVRTKAEADDIVADAEASGRAAKVKQIQQPDDQNHNYVIFDDADVKITAKESRASAATESQSVKSIKSVVDQFKRAFKGAAALDIRVVQNRMDIPVAFRPSPYAEGIFHDDAGLIYLVAGNITGKTRAFQILMHEAVGHYGLAAMMGERFSRIVARVKEAAHAKGKLRPETETFSYQPGDKDYATIEAVEMRYPDATESEIAQEVLARMAETDPGRMLFGYVRAMIRQWLRDTARALGIDLNTTTAELNDLVALASGYMRRGDNLAEERVPSGLVAASQKVGAGETAFNLVDVTSAAFKKWFGDSKVVDAGGNPLLVYHGTDADLTEFKRVDSRTGHPSAQLGFFFTASAKVADRFNRVKTDLPFSDIGKLDFAEGANQLPVYLSIKNPAVLSAKEFRDLMVDLGSPPDKVYGWMRTPEGWAALRDHFINAEGRDGVKILAERNVYSGSGLEEYAADQYVAFNPTQIKSAISNTGAFDSTNPSILESRAAQGKPQGPIWNSPESSRADDVIYTMQDKNIDLKRVQQAIKEVVGEIRDDIDTYLQEELFHGRAAKITEEFLDKEVNPLISLMRASKVSMDELETFLWARHAKERNAQIAKINDEMPDGGSGLTNKQADDLMAGKDVKIGDKTIAGVKPARKKLLSDLAGRVDAITKGNRALLERYSLESADTLNAWDGAYKHYVPLHREDAESHLAGMGTGQGYSVKGSSSKRATGSSRPVENILANLALQRERIITRGEKNRVAQSLYGLAKEMPNADLWEVDVKPTMRTTAMIGGREQVVDAIDPAFRSKPNVVFARFNGEDRFVVFNEHNERALRMAEALKNLDADDISHLLGEVSRWTRYFASINTQYNPIFGVTNLVRDVQTGLLNLKSTPIEGKQKELMGNLTHALPAVFKALRADRKGQSAPGSWAQLWEEFQEVGGQTGYRDMFRNSQERAEALQSALDPTWWQKTWWGKAATVGGVLAVPEQAFLDKVGKPLMELLSDYNTMMENGIRLAAYKVALDTGMTQARAASLAKNLTVNFNRKGQAARQVGAMYAFFNASIQGTARMAETLNHGAKPGELLGKAGKQIIYGGLMLGALQAMLLLAAGFDDEEPPEFVRDRNIIIPTGNGKYISIPLPLGFHVLPAISRISIEFTAGGFKKPGEHLVHIMDVLLDSFNPIGNAGLSMQTVAPTVLDPIAALTENKDWSGRQIARQDFSKLNPTPGYTRAKDTASSLSRGLAYALNYLSGGGEYGIGIVSPTPDQIDYLLGQLTGGVGRELGKVVTTAEALTTGEDLPPHKIPLAGRFYGNTTGQSSEASKFYGTLEKLSEHRGTLDRMKDAHDVEAYREYAKEHPEIRFYDRANKVQRELSSLRKLKRTMIERDADRAKIRQIEDRMKTLMARFNQAVSEQEGNHR